MSFPFLIYFISIELVAFHAFASICATCLVVNTFLLTIAHILPEHSQKELEERENAGANAQPKRKFGVKKLALLICKTANIALTVLAFLQIFISNLHFDIKADIDFTDLVEI